MELLFKMIVVIFISVLIFVFVYVTIGFIKELIAIMEKRRQWRKDDDLPLSVLEATIVAKQERECLQTGVTGKSATFISYRATFEFKNGDRKEFSISLPEYDMIAEGDAVQLSLQGARYVMLEKGEF